MRVHQCDKPQFTNVINPSAFVERKEEFSPTLIKIGATIGANATIICGVTVRCYAMIGAGSVVTKDVPDHALVVRNSVRPFGWVSRNRERLGDDVICARTGEQYQKTGKGPNLAPNSQLPIPFVDPKTTQACIKGGIFKHIQTILAHGIH